LSISEKKRLSAAEVFLQGDTEESTNPRGEVCDPRQNVSEPHVGLTESAGRQAIQLFDLKIAYLGFPLDTTPHIHLIPRPHRNTLYDASQVGLEKSAESMVGVNLTLEFRACRALLGGSQMSCDTSYQIQWGDPFGGGKEGR